MESDSFNISPIEDALANEDIASESVYDKTPEDCIRLERNITKSEEKFDVFIAVHLIASMVTARLIGQFSGNKDKASITLVSDSIQYAMLGLTFANKVFHKAKISDCKNRVNPLEKIRFYHEQIQREGNNALWDNFVKENLNKESFETGDLDAEGPGGYYFEKDDPGD